MQQGPVAVTSVPKAGDRALDQRALLPPPLSLPLSSLNHQDGQIIEKEGLENYIRGFMTIPGHGPHLCSRSAGQNTVLGANLTANKAGEGHRLVGPGEERTIW